MPEINYVTATMSDIIARSMLCHHSLFRDALIAAGQMHATYSHNTHSKLAAHIALGMANDCRRMADEIDLDDFDAASLALSEKIQAFEVACKLQLVTHADKTTIAGRA